MEFRFRAGDRPPPHHAPSITDAYLPTPALPGGYLGADLQRHDPLWNPMMPPLNPAMMITVREAVRRELEKERIREEIITAEILRMCALEEKVRRELAYDREVAMRRQAEQFSLQGMKHKKKAEEQELLLASKPGGGNKIQAAVEAAQSMNLNKVKKEPSCDPCNVRLTSERDLKNGHLQGGKHKAKAEEQELLIASENGGVNKIEAAVEAAQSMNLNKVKKEPSCDPCNVRLPSERDMKNGHLQGRKHKAEEQELLIASENGGGNKIEAAVEAAESMNLNKVKKEPSCDPCNVRVTSERDLKNGHLQGGKHKAEEQELLIASKSGGGNKIEAAVKAAESMNLNKVKKEWSCDLCNVRVTGEKDLKNGHLQGRKHKAKAKERELLIASENGGGTKVKAKEFWVPKNVKMEWSCDLCHPQAPRVQSLNDLHGKMHEAKEEELLIASKCDEGNKTEATEFINPNKEKKEWSSSLCVVSSSSQQHLKEHLQGKKHKAEEKLIKASKPDESNKTEAAESIDPNREWSCTLRQVRSQSEQVLNEHLQGKKHKAKEEELLIASEAASSSMTSKMAGNSNVPEKRGSTSKGQQKKLQQWVPKEHRRL